MNDSELRFRDREAAAVPLADELEKYRGTNSVVLAIPRGGVPVGVMIANSLGLPLDIVLSKKIGHPANKEFAIGSVTPDLLIIDHHPDVDQRYIEEETERIRQLLAERYRLYKGDAKPVDVKGKNVIIVDDGIATGNTILATVKMLRRKDPASVIIAVPVAPRDQVQRMRAACDEFICLYAPEYFPGVGAFYDEFPQVNDDEVIRLLKNVKHH